MPAARALRPGYFRGHRPHVPFVLHAPTSAGAIRPEDTHAYRLLGRHEPCQRLGSPHTQPAAHAPATFVEYPGGLQLWLNDHPSEHWRIRGAGVSPASTPASPALLSPKTKGLDRRRDGPPATELELPAAGWAAFTQNGRLFGFSALAGTNRADYLRSPDYTYLDGRGHWLMVPEAASDAALAIRPMGKDRLQIIRISGAGAFTIRRP